MSDNFNNRIPVVCTYYRLGLLIAALILTGCATRSLEECDPSDDRLLNSLQCRGQYKQRQKNLEAEVKAASMRARQSEESLKDTDEAKFESDQRLNELGTILSAHQRRIETLLSESDVSEDRIREMQLLWEEVTLETREVLREQAELADQQNDDDIQARLEELIQKEGELEALLLDLES